VTAPKLGYVNSACTPVRGETPDLLSFIERLKPEQLEKLEKISVREDLPVSWLIRKAIDEFLKRQK
jgi:hypothetical protein